MAVLRGDSRSHGWEAGKSHKENEPTLQYPYCKKSHKAGGDVILAALSMPSVTSDTVLQVWAAQAAGAATGPLSEGFQHCTAAVLAGPMQVTCSWSPPVQCGSYGQTGNHPALLSVLPSPVKHDNSIYSLLPLSLTVN